MICGQSGDRNDAHPKHDIPRRNAICRGETILGITFADEIVGDIARDSLELESKVLRGEDDGRVEAWMEKIKATGRLAKGEFRWSQLRELRNRCSTQ